MLWGPPKALSHDARRYGARTIAAPCSLSQQRRLSSSAVEDLGVLNPLSSDRSVEGRKRSPCHTKSRNMGGNIRTHKAF